jgi:hypothetical protein
MSGKGKFGTLPWAPGRSKKIDLNGNELAITSLSDINNKKYMSKKVFSMIFESHRLLLLMYTQKLIFRHPKHFQNDILENILHVGVQSKNKAYHNVNKVLNSFIDSLI